MKIKNLKYTKPSTFEYQGKTYSLEHLQPLHIMVNVKGKDIPVKIEFGTHVFTEKYDNKIHTHASQIQDVSHWKKAHYRAFDIKRLVIIKLT